ncbi:hypothetical protein [Sphingomicrobium flavum]|uniref:hypothetical protein n=1 Tax=Sphingomicrobium flavum TaxID=1229164 RepID=UPI0021ADA790|nr:hypothetical protein [Sphingomicrobium flavum]
MRHVITLLASSALAFPALAQDPDPDPDLEDEETIVVQGERARGSVEGDIEPELVLDARDIAATGATSIAELLEALEPDIGSARGRASGPPVLLINGKRTSGFRELRDLPPEAIERVDVLPEETALQFGFKADQRVVNFVLRERFNSFSAELEYEGATDGGRDGGEIDFDKMIIADGNRTSISLDLEGASALTEDERDIILQPIETPTGVIDPRPSRTLLGETRLYRVNATHSRTIGEVGATLNLEVEQREGQGLNGPAIGRIDIPGDSPFATVPLVDERISLDSGLGAIVRDTRSRSASLASAFNGGGDWLWSVTASGSIADSRTLTDLGPDLTAEQALVNALDPALNPRAITSFTELGRQEATSVTKSLAADGVLNGIIGAAPGGDIRLTLRGNASVNSIESDGFRAGQPLETQLTRRRAAAAFSTDLPLLDSFSAIGELGLNANGEIEEISDFGALYSVGAGINWKPTERLGIIASWTREDGAPTLAQLGNPRISDPNVRFFDFVNGETVLLTAISGGNPDLRSDLRNVWKLGANWDVPLKSENSDLRLRTEFVRQRIEDPVASFPAASAAIEAAFPDRFIRNGAGQLVQVDLTPVNYDSSRRDTFQWGLNWSKSVTTKPPSPEQIAQFRERFQRQRSEGAGGRPTPPAGQGAPQQAEGQAPQGQTAPEGQTPQQGQPSTEGQAPQQGQSATPGQPPAQGAAPGGRPQPTAEQRQRFQQRARRGGFAGGRGGRIFASVNHTITLNDDVLIAPGLPLLDYLDGEAAGSFGGRPRHSVDFRLGRFNNGIGFFVNGNWRSATSVDSGEGELRFDDFATVDARFFINFNERFDVMAKAPWLRGTSLRIGVENVFNARPNVRDSFGEVPIGYQPDLLLPEGRTFSISIRKLFVPSRFGQGGGFGGGRGGPPGR